MPKKVNVESVRRSLALIKDEVDRTRGVRATPEISATSRNEDIAQIAAVLQNKVPPTLLNELGDAYRALDAAEDAKTVAETRTLYAAAASKFDSVRTKLGPELQAVRTRGNMPVGYFINIELANSYAFSEQSDRWDAAIGLYKQLLDEYPNDPTVAYRYARAITRNNPTDKDLDIASGLIDKIPAQVKDDPLTGPSHWLPMAAAMLKGYVHYARVKDKLPMYGNK